MIENILNKKYGEFLAGLDIYENKNSLVLSRIIVKDEYKNTGIGTKVMNDLVQYADSNKKIIALTPASDFGGNKNRLIQFYKKFGFKMNQGHHKSYEYMQTMIRYPKLSEMVSEEEIKGGLADNKTSSDIAKKHSVPVKDITKELNMGIKVEMEHVDDEKKAKEIALDHLFEIPDYYTRLKKMEDEAKKDLNLDESLSAKIQKGFNKIKDISKREGKASIVLFKLLSRAAISYAKTKDFNLSDEEKTFMRGQSKNIARITPLILVQAVPLPIPISPFLILLGKKIGIDLVPKEQQIPTSVKEETTKSFIKRLFRESVDLSVKEKSGDEHTFEIYYNKRKAGHITCGPAKANFEDNTHQIFDLQLDDEYSNLNVATQAIKALWSAHPEVNRIVISVPPSSQLFWEKLGFTRLNDSFHQLMRGH
jgi:ribosomal protein S18 acetylase RimI-like enzyme